MFVYCTAAMQGQVDPVYLAGATFLKSIGFINSAGPWMLQDTSACYVVQSHVAPYLLARVHAEIARVLDVAMNPNSLFVEFNDRKRSRNANVRGPASLQMVSGIWAQQ